MTSCLPGGPFGNPHRAKRRRGFSLLEVMVASSLFLLTISGVISATRQLTASSAHQRHMTMATHLAEFTLEELLLRFSGSDDLRPDLPHARSFSLDGEPVASGGFYTATWTVAAIPLVPNLRQLTVVLSWTEHGETKTITLLTNRS